MNTPVVIAGFVLPAWLAASIAVTLWITGLLVIKGLVLRYATRLAANTPVLWDDILVRAIRAPLNMLITGSALMLGGRLLPLSPAADQALTHGWKALLIITLALAAYRLTHEYLRAYAPRIEFLRVYQGFIHSVVQALILVIGGLVLLESFGISITPILASLGIGSLAVALALQDTLANFFAGIHLVVDKPVQVGQFVRLESGQEGYVTHIGARSTQIRMLANNVVIVPNAKLASTVVTNYYYPDKELAVLVEIGVHYQSDLAQVERVTCAVAKEVLQHIAGGVAVFEPMVRYHTFGESSINFTVVLRAKEFTDQYLLKHEFIKRLHARYRQEGIVIPFPTRTIDLASSDRLTVQRS